MRSQSGEHEAQLLARARGGDAHALEALLVSVRDDVYGLALRMLWHPEDAEDATQEILIKVTTRLETFRGESTFGTWVYRIAANHLLTTRRRRMERQQWTFDAFAADLADGLDFTADDRDGPEQQVLAEEVKIGCTLAMLQCLDRDHRLAFILGDVFAMPSEQAADICDTAPAAYRKRLSRARGRIRDFMARQCGLVTTDAQCRCHRRIAPAIAAGRVDPAAPMFIGHGRRSTPAPDAAIATMEQLHDAAAIFRSHPSYRAPERVTAAVIALLRDHSAALFHNDSSNAEQDDEVGM
jgi:RNA polymerase sigma factor (sigma-70 family)